jgi:hypothetical protein
VHSKRYDLDDYSSSSLNSGSGRWLDDDSMPEEGAPLAKPDKDGVVPLVLFGEELVIFEGFCPGSHVITLLSRFKTVHFVGDWLVYLQFAHWADIQSLERPDVAINLGDWLGLKSGT